MFAQLRSNNQVTDQTARTYFENVGGKWNTLIRTPRQQDSSGKTVETVPLGGYFGDDLKYTSRASKVYLTLTGIAAVLFVLSFLALLALIVLNFSNSKKFKSYAFKYS